MKHHRWLVPYFRRRHPKDRSESIRAAVRMEFYGDDCFVQVQRGHKHLVVAVARTRRELVRSVLVLHRTPGGKHVRAWANRVGRYCRGDGERPPRRRAGS